MRNNNGITIAALIKEIYLKLNNNISNEFRNTRLTIPQLMVVRILAKHKRLKVSEIGEMMNLTKGTISGIIDRLEKQEIILKIRSKEDKRIVYVELAENGKNLALEMKDTMGDYFDSIFSKCSEEDMKKIFEGLALLKSIVDELEVNLLDH